MNCQMAMILLNWAGGIGRTWMMGGGGSETVQLFHVYDTKKICQKKYSFALAYIQNEIFFPKKIYLHL